MKSQARKDLRLKSQQVPSAPDALDASAEAYRLGHQKHVLTDHTLLLESRITNGHIQVTQSHDTVCCRIIMKMPSSTTPEKV